MISGGFPSLGASNLSRAVRFYVETMGMKLAVSGVLSARMDAGENFTFELLKDGPKVTTPLCFIARSDLEETRAIYENRGIVFTREDAQTPRYRFEDSEGNQLCLTK